jgi:hypothetical protein
MNAGIAAKNAQILRVPASPGNLHDGAHVHSHKARRATAWMEAGNGWHS